MKRVVSAALIVFVLAALTVSAANAQLTTVTSFQVQNLSGDTANLQIVFYDANGDEVGAATVSDTIAGNSSKLYTQGNNTDLPSGFNGSVVISADQEVAAIGVQKTANNDDSQQYQGTYSGFAGTQAAETFYIPTVMKAFYGYTTEISVQNAGSSNVDVNVSYSGGQSDSTTGLKPGEAHRFDNADTSGMADGFIGSATISATGGPIVAVVNQVNEAALEEQTYEGFSAAGAGTELYTPVLMRNFYQYNTSIKVQKIGSGSTDVTITYSNGHAETQTLTDASDSYLFTQQNETNLPASWLGSATITSTSLDIIAVVNQQNTTTGKAASYNGFAQAAARFVGPNVMKSFYGFNTSVQVQNLGSSTTCTASFSNGTSQTSTTLAQGQTYLFTQGNNNDLGSSFAGSVDLTCGGEDFVAVVNQEGPTGPGDTQMAYNAIPAP